jgi:serine/threonine protein kinase
MKFKPSLALDVGLTDSSSSSSSSSKHQSKNISTWKLGETTYRNDSFSIGKDFFRLEGRTVSRGQLCRERLDIQGVLGKGNFSTVHHAHWRRRDNQIQHVALKQICLVRTSKKQRDMLLQELRTLCLLKSEFLVSLLGAFLRDDTIFMVLELMDEGSLQDFFNDRHGQGFGEDFTAAVAFQVLGGLSYLHANQLVHRDVKPGNILLHSSGNVKLCDFGMTVLNDDSMNTTVVGTTKYMAPERLNALPYGRSSDIWSFGIVLRQCITGEVPWKDITSLVELVVTVEDTEMEDLVPTNIEQTLQEMLLASLQKHPGKYLLSRCPSCSCTIG